jgi:hypothetical protein
VDPGEECDEDSTECQACKLVAACGDGIVTPSAGEACDPPDGINCGLDCKPLSMCGNNHLDPCEQCEPPGRRAHSGGEIDIYGVDIFGVVACDSSCQIPRCGNLKVDPGEDCDPPDDAASALNHNGFCDATCHFADKPQ